MKNVTLKNGFAMRVEPHNGKVRIVVLKDGEDYVCRIEEPKKLERLIALNETNIFKGRLQLLKQQGQISIIAKKQIIGHIEEQAFLKYIEGTSQ